MEIRPPDDPGIGRSGTGEAGGVSRGWQGQVSNSPAAGRGRSTLHVDEVLDRQAEARASGVEAGDEGTHGGPVDSTY